MARTDLKKWAVQECRGWSGGPLKRLCRLMELLRRKGWVMTAVWHGTVYLRDVDRRRLRVSQYEPQPQEPYRADLSLVIRPGSCSARTLLERLEATRCSEAY